MAVHEGIEAMRWLMEERGGVMGLLEEDDDEELGLCMSPYRSVRLPPMQEQEVDSLHLLYFCSFRTFHALGGHFSDFGDFNIPISQSSSQCFYSVH